MFLNGILSTIFIDIVPHAYLHQQIYKLLKKLKYFN